MNTIKIDNEETDVETIIETKEILITEMDYIFEKLLAMEQRINGDQTSSSGKRKLNTA